MFGKDFKTISDGDLKLFEKNFEEFNVFSWIDKFDLYTDEKISIDNVVRAKQDDQAFVNVSIVSKDPSVDAVDIQLRVRMAKNGELKIADIKVAGSSMLLTYKKEFKAVMDNSGKSAGEEQVKYLISSETCVSNYSSISMFLGENKMSYSSGNKKIFLLLLASFFKAFSIILSSSRFRFENFQACSL